MRLRKDLIHMKFAGRMFSEALCPYCGDYRNTIHYTDPTDPLNMLRSRCCRKCGGCFGHLFKDFQVVGLIRLQGRKP